MRFSVRSFGCALFILQKEGTHYEKALSLILALVMCLSLCACGGDGTSQETGDDAQNTEAPAPAETTWYPINETVLVMWEGLLFQEYFVTRPDGTFVDGWYSEGTWSMEDDILTCTYTETSASYQYQVAKAGSITYLINAGNIYSSVPVGQIPTTNVEMTLDNWADYFEIKTITHESIFKDQFGDVISTEVNTATMLVLKEEYARRCVASKSEFLFRYDTDTDAHAEACASSEADYPLYGAEINGDYADVSQFPMVKVQGTLVLIEGI